MMDVYELLALVKSGDLSIDHAAEQLKNLPYEDIDFAKIDHHRKLRTGRAEVIFCQGKTPEQAAEIFKRLAGHNENVLATRADRQHFEHIQREVPDVCYNEAGRTVSLIRNQSTAGRVAICTGGTADIPVAEEAAVTAETFGAAVDRYYDVGVSGIHRLLDCVPEIRKANAVVAVAGMEGALPSVLAGMIDIPVIAVPTSIGYGANFGGVAALLTMLNSCAAGIGVVNIDNGFGAGYLAAQINSLVEKNEKRA